MGKPTGFIDYKRVDPKYRPKDKRLTDYKTVELMLSHDEIKRQSARCMDCGTPFCHAYGCPVSNVIPEFNDFVFRGKWQEALDILLSTNNFPEFTGRICPAPCETSCVAGINFDPVTIRQIELAIIEKGFESGYIPSDRPKVRLKERVAVIGAGPSGLAVADSLNRDGYNVTVYDNAAHPGGILRYGIPDFKLEKWVVERRIRLMQDQGIIFETGVSAGEDISYNYLTRRFDAICLTCGSRAPRDLNIPGRECVGIHFVMDFLTQQNKRVGQEKLEGEDEIWASGKKVVVIGGGDTGSDCLGTSLRQGADKVTQLEILPKPPETRAESTPWPMWPLMLRLTHAHKEGGETLWSVMTKKFKGKDGKLKSLSCVEVEWQVKEEGRPPIPVEKPGTEFEIKADMALLAMGFVGPARNKLVKDLKVKLDDRGNIKADKNHMISVEGVFVAGDMRYGQSLVVRAISDGREAAQGIKGYLKR